MSDRWVESPAHLPRKCHRTANSSQESGPYFEHNWAYYDADPNAAATGELRHLTLYQSREWIKHMLSQPGSPYVPVSADEWMDAIVERKNLEDRISELESKIEELQADLIVALEQEQFVLRDEDIERLADAMKPKPRAKKAA
jgi:uncharacterized protein YdcH (DUF465 family)